eukprot:COSAG02_NODE_67320_length_253_cov_0.675325_1_plen_32_part_01
MEMALFSKLCCGFIGREGMPDPTRDTRIDRDV